MLHKNSYLRASAVVAAITVILLLGAVPGYCQTSSANGRIEGTVADQSGAVVPGAAVAIKDAATGMTAEQTSDATGHFVFLTVRPGTYEITIRKTGFKKMVLGSVVVSVGTTTRLHPQLSVGTANSVVTVNATDVPLVDTTQSGIANVVSERAITQLPLNGRNFTDFVLLTPGVSTDGDFGMISFNGLAGNYNNYTVDGANNNNAFFAQQMGRTSIPYQFSEDVIQEFQVASNGFNAEFGQAGGGVVNTVTKSGTNSYHGDGYYYITDSSLNANDKVNEQLGIPKPNNRRQQFGGTVGGPIIKDRLFWIANYEGQVRNEPVTVNTAPLGLDTLPANFFSQNPAIATLVTTAQGSHPRSFNQNVAFVKVSGNITQNNTFDATYNYQRFRSPHGYFNTPTSTGDGLTLTDGATSQFFQFTLHTLISPTFTNEARFHYGGDLHFDLPDTTPNSPAVVIQNPDSGVVLGGNRFQLSTTDHRYEFGDDMTKVWGRHTIKAGVDININSDSDYFVYGPAGAYFFGSLQDMAAAGGSQPNWEYYLQSFGQSTANFKVPSYSLFVQDEFRATSRLTLNYGLRWDMQALTQPSVCNPQFKQTCKIPYSKANIAPRAGFAYSLDKNGSTVVRGSFGLFYAMTDLLDVSEALLSNGVSRQFLFVPGPAFGNSNPIVSYPNSLSAFPSGAGGTPSLVVFNPNFRNPYVEQGSLQVEHQFGAHTAVSVGYVYTHGLKLLGNSNGVTRQANGNFGYDINLFPPAQQPSQGGTATDTIKLPNGHTYTVPDYGAFDGYLNPNFSTINEVDNSGKSMYNGLQISVRHSSQQFTGGLAYTFSKVTDEGTGYYNQFAKQAQRGLSQLDQTHRLVLTGAWSPVQRYVKGFSFGSVLTLASGRPFEPELDASNINFKMVPGEGFNSFRGPGVSNVDFNVSRVVKLSERMHMKLMAEAFNIFNHPNFQQSPVDQVQYNTAPDPSGAPNAYIATPNPTFGQPLAAAPRYGARSVQLSARISF